LRVLAGAYDRGVRAALQKHGLAQPSLASVGISAPVKAPGLPGAARTPSIGVPSLKLTPNASAIPNPMTLGMQAAKVAANVGIGMMTPGYDSASGGVRGQPAEEGRRQRSVIDRAFQQNEDFYATSSMPEPGAVSP
jgi:hypothetical protein